MERVGRKGGWVWFREILEAKTRRILGSGDILEEEIGSRQYTEGQNGIGGAREPYLGQWRHYWDLRWQGRGATTGGNHWEEGKRKIALELIEASEGEGGGYG